MIDTSWLIITIISLAFSALFSGIEIAFVTSDRVRVELDIQKGGFIGRVFNIFYSRSEFFISTILVGNNIMLVIYGMGAAKMIEPWLEGIYPNQAFVLICQTLISTGIILLTGEFLPKSQPLDARGGTALGLVLFHPLSHLALHHLALQGPDEDFRHTQ